MSQPDTKAAWKRRALRAEAELASIRDMRQFEHSMELLSHRERPALKVAIGEIEDSIKWAREYIEGSAP